MAKRRHKVFLDSNVILSGLLSDKGSPSVILDILSLNLPVLSGATGQYNIKDFNKPGLKNKYGFQILSPSEFVEEILPEILRSV